TQPDPHWFVAAAPSSNMPFPAYATNRYSSWAAAPTGTQWIERLQNFSSLTGPDFDVMGSYTYRLPFNLNTTLYSSIQIVGQYTADNTALIQLNGVTQTFCASATCFTALIPLSINGSFVNGFNTLDVVVNNQAYGPTGLVMQATLRAFCAVPTPSPTR